jgi:hypothetical protein
MTTHPMLLRAGHAAPSSAYDGRTVFPDEWNRPLPRPPDGAATLAYRADLAAPRSYAARHASNIGLSPPCVLDLVLAVGELGANTLRHTNVGGVLAIWSAGNELLCEIQDTGHISDPLAGRRRPAADADGGHGLWIVHQLTRMENPFPYRTYRALEIRVSPG